jgi:hypothetical protein
VIITLQAQHHADEQAGDDDDHQRIVADEMDLLGDQAGRRIAPGDTPIRPKKERVAKPTLGEGFAHRAADAGKDSADHARAPRPRSSASDLPG